MAERYLTTGNCAQAIHDFLREYPNNRRPSLFTILYNVRKFREHSSLQNRHPFNSGRRGTVRTPENIERVRQAILDKSQGKYTKE